MRLARGWVSVRLPVRQIHLDRSGLARTSSTSFSEMARSGWSAPMCLRLAIPYDRRIVHPERIYTMAGIRTGVARNPAGAGLRTAGVGFLDRAWGPVGSAAFASEYIIHCLT